ncbi:MAG TPA: universal stress protein [Massilia sp.]|nr:universal stress protein [Massilia sp.]
MYKRILIPTDGSQVSGLAADAAIELARSCGSGIVTLSIVVPEPVLPYVEGGIVLDTGQQTEALLENAHGFVGTVAERARRSGIECTPVTQIDPDPARAIVEAAGEYECDLIVMGSHGRRGLSRLLAGSVTQAVLAYAPVPVMVLRPALPDEQAEALARPCPASARLT